MLHSRGKTGAICLWLLLMSQSWAEQSIVFGYSREAEPVSYDGNGVGGFCGAVSQYLNSLHLSNGGIDNVPLERVDKRFGEFAKTLKNHQVGIQCGPSSATESRQQALTVAGQYKGQFSAIFFTTNTKVLVRKDKVGELFNGAPLKIGILNPAVFDACPNKTSNTGSNKGYCASAKLSDVITTGSISGVFPHVQLIPVKNRQDVMDGLVGKTLSGEMLDGYAGDAIILENMRRALGRQKNQYSIEPPLGSFIREDFVLVIYNDTPELNITAKLNAWLQSEGSDAIASLESAREGDMLLQGLSDALVWLNRSDHLQLAFSVMAGFCLFVLGLTGGLWWWVCHVKRKLTYCVSPIAKALASDLKSSNDDGSLKVEKQVFLHYSRELHDNICQLIVGVKRQVEMGVKLMDNNDQAPRATLAQSLVTLDQISQEVRKLSHDIRSEVEDVLDDLLHDFSQRTGIVTSRHGNLQWRSIPKTISTDVYRVVQEVLLNIEKHAAATQVQVTMANTGNQLCLTIQDNGQGMDTKQLTVKKGIGLKNMRDRIKGLQGQLLIDSQLGQGTQVQINVPCEMID
ncbi:MAG: hypothetical protein RI964_621 [Pseudomonadota bacterium]|jgi:hypothetical protein